MKYKNQLEMNGNGDSPFHKYKSIYIVSIHGAYDFKDAKDTRCSTTMMWNQFAIERLLGEERKKEIAAEVFDAVGLKDVAAYDDYWCDLYYVYGTVEELRHDAERIVDYAIPLFYESGGDGTHFDELPSFLEEIIQFCVGIDYIAPIQRLYDSLWQGPPVEYQEKPDSADLDWVQEKWNEGDESMKGFIEWAEHGAYYPLDDDDPCLYLYFEDVDGLVFHELHPKD